jgi:hypothetical protein
MASDKGARAANIEWTKSDVAAFRQIQTFALLAATTVFTVVVMRWLSSIDAVDPHMRDYVIYIWTCTALGIAIAVTAYAVYTAVTE